METAAPTGRGIGPPVERGDPVGSFMRGLGELMVTAGAIVLLFVVYELYVTDVISERTQDTLSRELREDWGRQPAAAAPPAEPPDVPVGEAFAFLHIPRLGEDFPRAVVQGTGQAELAGGPGHYVDTAMPGQPGNMAVAGHRVGKGSPFLDLDLLRPGDPIVVETAVAWYEYRLLGDRATGDLSVAVDGVPGRRIVDPTQIGVIAPVPGQPGVAPTASYLTLTTCHPKYSAEERLIVHAVLAGAPVARAALPDGPAALQESPSD
ncbi:class E sortase [Blastococcus haudaquaticus]|uniref:Sortase A n=1 Tax=Blastococcus haudaquaticus TaxID=1938745 RepID=A0A286H5E6_9ACTN|nr:class E sortase [Blastococcus haudaquaticus]SOE03030.1 sortase A [Blastococcus haudaquaticus]